jgi:hypothetical protein
VIARQWRQRGRLRRAQSLPSDLLATDQPADVPIGHRWVGDDGQDRIQQLQATLTGLGAFGQVVTHPVRGLALPRRHGLVEQLHDLIQYLGRRLRQQRQQDRVPALRLPPLQRLCRQATPDGGKEPAVLRRQYRQIQRVRVHPAQELQLLHLRRHRRGRGFHRPGAQPPKPSHPNRGVHHQQAIQSGPALAGKLVRQQAERLPPRLFPGVRDPLDHRDRARPDHPRRHQVLTRQPEQQHRRIMFHRPCQQELIQFLRLWLTRWPPLQVPRGQQKVIGPRLRPPPVRIDRIRSDLQLFPQPGHRRPWSGCHVIRHEPQPRQRAQGDSKT